MNIFVLDESPRLCAMYHADKHVVKMPIESAQILCTIMRERCNIDMGYESVYINHPCTRWAGEAIGNFQWLLDLGLELCTEFSYRYQRDHHATYEVLLQIDDYIPQIAKILPVGSKRLYTLERTYTGMTPFYSCVSEQFKVYDTIIAYRLYYYFVKTRLHKWTRREVPKWITNGVEGIAEMYQEG